MAPKTTKPPPPTHDVQPPIIQSSARDVVVPTVAPDDAEGAIIAAMEQWYVAALQGGAWERPVGVRTANGS
jgi:hypothetical protein